MFCKKCGTPLSLESKFCKKCGNPMVFDTSPNPNHLNETTEDSKGVHQDLYFPSNLMQSVMEQLRKTTRSFWFGIVTVVVLITVGYFFYSRMSLERKIEASIANGNILYPPGESAYDYFYQLKQKSISESTRTRLIEKLLPVITARPQKMIFDIATPGRADATLADWQEAQKLMSWAMELRSNDNNLAARANYTSGRLSYMSNRKDDAIAFWKRAAELDPMWALPLNGIGLIYNERKSYQLARSFFFEAIRREPQFSLPYNNIGTSFFYEKDDVQAEKYYSQAIDRAPQWPRPHAWMGDIYMRRKSYSQALQEYETVLNLDPVGASGIDVSKIRQQLEQVRKMVQLTDFYTGGVILLTTANPVVSLLLHQDRWSERVVPPSSHTISFNGPPEAVVLFADGTEGPLNRNYGTNSEWLKGFRFRGPEGSQVIVRITPMR